MIAISNHKGGVGKSALTTIYASILHYNMNKSVVVFDCDPQHSIIGMREDDKKKIITHPEIQAAFQKQFEKTGIKAYKIVRSTPEKAIDKAYDLMDEVEYPIDVMLFDLPGTVVNEGLLNLYLNMDYLFVPIIADERTIASSYAFVLSLTKFNEKYGKEYFLKDIYFFWNKVDRREHTHLYDYFNNIIEKENMKRLKTIIPDTKKYNKELSETRNVVFRSTFFPPDRKLRRNTNIDELVKEINKIIGL